MERRKFLTSAALGTAGTVLAAPMVNAQNAKTMTIVSTWPRDFPGLGTSAQRLVERINLLSQGQIQAEYFAAGERVGAFDSFDEVTSGNSQAYVAADYYWTGKHPAFAYFCTVPFGMVTSEWNAWIKFGGGQALWDKLGDEFGLKAVVCGQTGAQAGGWFNKEINTPEDLNGLKMRIPGLAGTVMTKLGVSTISLPGGQIYENLVSGAIDATEWVGPYNDFFLKLYEAAQFYYTAGMHEPAPAIALGMNASWWNSLSEWEQEIITAAAYEENAAQFEEGVALNGEYLQRLVNVHLVQVRDFSDDVWVPFGAASQEVYEETREHSALAAEINDTYQQKLREYGGMMAKFETRFVNQRNRILGLS